MECTACGSDDTIVYAAEDDTERDVRHCFECGADQVL